MLTSKYIAHFLEEVSSWQKKLSAADSVITIWIEVQRTWSHLESIFIGSEDIRKQLPEDSERFEQIDTDFKVATVEILTKVVYFLKNVVFFNPHHFAPNLATNSLFPQIICTFVDYGAIPYFVAKC